MGGTRSTGRSGRLGNEGSPIHRASPDRDLGLILTLGLAASAYSRIRAGRRPDARPARGAHTPSALASMRALCGLRGWLAEIKVALLADGAALCSQGLGGEGVQGVPVMSEDDPEVAFPVGEFAGAG